MKPIDPTKPVKAQEFVLSKEFYEDQTIEAIKKHFEPGYNGYLFSPMFDEKLLKMTAFYNVERAEIIIKCAKDKVLEESLKFIRLNNHAKFYTYRAGEAEDDFIRNLFTVMLFFTFPDTATYQDIEGIRTKVME